MRFDIPHFLAIIKQSLGSVGSGARAVRGKKPRIAFWTQSRQDRSLQHRPWRQLYLSTSRMRASWRRSAHINAIFIADRQGIPIAMSDPKSGKHHDVHEIGTSLDQILGMV